MSHFLLHNGTIKLGDEALRNVFPRYGKTSPRNFSLGHRTLYWWPEGVPSDQSVLTDHATGSIFVSGTLVYGTQYGTAALRLILDHLRAGEFSAAELRGDFVALIWQAGRLGLLISETSLLTLYTNGPTTALSTSFLALRLTGLGGGGVETEAVMENLLTGCIFGNKTLLKGIRRVLDPQPAVDSRLVDFVLRTERPAPPTSGIRSFEECVEAQLSALSGYLASVKPLLVDAGAYLGLSGGYDSRLLYLLARRCGCPLRIFTHHKDGPDREIDVARKITGLHGSSLRTVPVRQLNDMDEDHLGTNLRNSFELCDAQVRVNLGWLEDYRQSWYRQAVRDGMGVGLDGIGGEQYRNHTHLIGQLRASAWIKYQVIEGRGWDAILETAQQQVLERLWLTICSEMGWKERDHVTLAAVKAFHTRLWVRDGAFVRIVLGNQIGWFLAPFTDPRVRLVAEQAIDFLGAAGRLEGEMIRRLDAQVAAVESNYGHPLDQTPRSTVFRAQARRFIPEALVAWRRQLASPRSRSNNQARLLQMPCIRESVEALRGIGLPLRWDVALGHPWLFNRGVALGFCLRQIA